MLISTITYIQKLTLSIILFKHLFTNFSAEMEIPKIGTLMNWGSIRDPGGFVPSKANEIPLT
jgi:hypothetical protein